VGCFETRRQAELAVEHCVQEHGVNRADIFIQAAESENTAGTVIGGADARSAPPTTEERSDPALHGVIEVSVEVNDDRADVVRAAFEDAGAQSITAR
jgi:hypothetical protein